jgi:hypothetical protein
MPGKSCRVSFTDLDGIRHSVEVEADSLYEAAVLGLKALKKGSWVAEIGAGTRITIQVVEPPVEHFLMYAQLQRWLNGAVTNPAEAVRKKRLREMLAS